MAYTVLALKWRPKGFEEVVGQPHIVSNIASAIEKNKVAHAYMFSGPRGVGKTSCARIFAKALNCVKGPTASPCGVCPACVDIAAGRSLDVLEIDGASNRGIDEIRTLRENIKFAPASGRYKVYIIDEVHQITADGFNALLKTLEEPPDFVKFILATTAPQKVPSTILSRCQRMDFRRISVLEIISQLEKIVAAEGGEVDREVLFAIARASDGALRDAESILDQLLSFSKGKVSVDDVVAMLGNVQLETLFQISDAVKARDSRAILALVNDLIDKGKDAAVLFQDLIGHFRNLMVARVSGADARLIDLPGELCEKLVGQAQGFSLEELFGAFTILVEAQEMSRRMESVRIPLEICLVRLCAPKGAYPASVSAGVSPRGEHPASSAAGVQPRSVRPAPAAVEGHPRAAHPAVVHTGAHSSSNQTGVSSHKGAHPESTISGVPSHKGTQSSTAPKMVSSHKGPVAQDGAVPVTEAGDSRERADEQSAVPGGGESGAVVSREDVTGGFDDVVREVAKSRMSVATYLREASIEDIGPGYVSIGFPRDLQFHKEFLDKKENKALVEKCFSGRFGCGLKVRIVFTDKAAKPAGDENDPAVRSAIDTFNGRLL